MAGRRKGQVHIGTSGWTYEHWLGRFYPAEAKGESRLRQYARAFKSVEINATFYRMPSERAMDNWLAETPDDFLFAVKASRYIAHRKRLKYPEIHVPIFTTRILRMKPKLGPVLYQLPPSLAANLDRLKALLDRLPDGVRYTTEFRHESWWTEEVYACLRAHGIAFCLFHLAGRETPEIVTADSVYIRLHGPGAAYQGPYKDETLRAWAEKIERWMGEGRDAYIYFDNDEKAYAAEDARRLQEMIADS